MTFPMTDMASRRAFMQTMVVFGRSGAAGGSTTIIEGGAERIFESSTALAAANVAAPVKSVRLDGYAAAGDGGAALYTRVAAEPAHAAKIQSADGQWWEMAEAELRPEMFGAVGDGLVNDHAAFLRLTGFINEKGTGVVVLSPTATYVVHDETADPSPGTPFYNNAGPPLEFDGVSDVIIHGNGATMKTANGLHYGQFDPITGAASFNGPPFTDPDFRATPGDMIRFTNSHHCRVYNVRGDGNTANLVQGGQWGDVGYQIQHTGLEIDAGCTDIIAHDCEMNDFVLDGFTIRAGSGFGIRMDCALINPTALRNGRQGFSWIGGWGITVINPTFALTGTGALTTSGPRANIDLEANAGQDMGEGAFLGGRCYDSAGVSFLQVSPVTDVRVIGMSISNANNSAVWTDQDGIAFSDCDIWGNVLGRSNAMFDRCIFSNGLKLGTTKERLIIDNQDPVSGLPATYRNCEIHCYDTSGLNFDFQGNCIIENTVIRLRQTDPVPRSLIGRFGACTMKDVSILDEYTLTGGNITDQNGERTILLVTETDTVLRGRNILTGDNVALNSREGFTNEVIRTRLTNGDTVPDISRADMFRVRNNSATVITGFNGGLVGDRIELHFENANTTIAHGGPITLLAGADTAYAANTTARFLQTGPGTWAEI